MKRLLNTIFATSLGLGLAACEGEAPKNDETAKADAPKADAAKDTPADAAKDTPDDADPAQDDAPADDADAPPEATAEDAAADEDDLEGYDPRVSKAARIAAQINEDPEKADEMLAAADLDREKLDALMYEIANDPNLTAQYRMARGI